MKRLLCMVSLMGALTACVTPEQNIVGGAALGALGGAAIAGDGNRTEGALIGGALGLAAGTLVGRSNSGQYSGQCLYERRDGSRYYSNC